MLPTPANPLRILHGDCRELLPSFPNASVQLAFLDPPYPCLPKPYGIWTEEEWFDLMNAVMPELRRVLTPSGSAVIYLKPNSAKAGRMRLWLWEFLATWGRKWNLVQDAYVWNYSQLPFGGATQCGLMRGSVATCLWFGAPDCYRDQDAVLLPESDVSKYKRSARTPTWKTQFTSPSASKRKTDTPRLDQKRAYAAAERRGGVTPFNLIPATNTTNAPGDAGTGHPARTADAVVRYWIRYLTKPGDLVLDPFAGGGGTLFVAAEEGRRAVGIEQKAEYVAGIRKRIAAAKVTKLA